MFTNTTLLWILIAIIMCFLEAVTFGLVAIWFAAGAIIAALVSAVGGPIWLQVVIFLLVSVLCLVFILKWARIKLNSNREKTNADSLIGQKAVVTEAICNIDAVGKVEINGMEWTARQIEGTDERDGLPIGTIVIVEKIQGVKLIVKKEEIQ